MKLALQKEDIKLNLVSRTKEAVIKELVHFFTKRDNLLSQEEEIFNCVMEREKLQTTGIGKKIAVPHAKTEAVTQLYVIAGTSKEGIDFDSIDNLPTHLFFLIISPRSSSGPHVKALSTIAKLTSNEQLKNNLINAENEETFYNILKTGEQLL